MVGERVVENRDFYGELSRQMTVIELPKWYVREDDCIYGVSEGREGLGDFNELLKSLRNTPVL